MFFEVALIAAFVAMLAWGIGDFLIQRSVRKVGDIESLAVIGIFGAIALAPWGLPALISDWSTTLVVGLCVFGIFMFLKSIVNFEALRVGKLSVVEVMCELELPLVVLLGVVFLKEYISGIQIILIGLVFIGVVLMALRKSLRAKHLLEKGAFLALITAVCFALSDYFTAHFSRQVNAIALIWFLWLIIAVCCFVFMIRKNKLRSFARNLKKYKRLLISSAVCDTLAWVLYAYALASHEIAIVTAITESYVVVGLLLGIIFNGEKMRGHQALGAIIAFASSVILAIVS